MKNLNIILSTFILAFFTLSCSSDDDSGSPDPGSNDGNGSYEYNIDGVGSYTSAPEDMAYVVYSKDPEDLDNEDFTGVYIINGTSDDGDNTMNVFLYELNGEIITSINDDAEISSGAYISHTDGNTYFSTNGQIEILHASHGQLNESNIANAKVELKFNGQFINFNEELTRTTTGSINADTPPLFYPGL